jgi:hypothetical protein
MGCDDPSVAAQAAEFIRALRVQLLQMTSRLTWIERQGVTGRSSREIRLEAGALRRDIVEAKVLIDRLQRRYLYGDERKQRVVALRTGEGTRRNAAHPGRSVRSRSSGSSSVGSGGGDSRRPGAVTPRASRTIHINHAGKPKAECTSRQLGETHMTSSQSATLCRWRQHGGP